MGDVFAANRQPLLSKRFSWNLYGLSEDFVTDYHAYECHALVHGRRPVDDLHCDVSLSVLIYMHRPLHSCFGLPLHCGMIARYKGGGI